MSNRYDTYIAENEARITELQARIVNFQERGVRLSSIPRIEAEISELQAQIVKYRGTSKLTKDLTGF